MGFAVLCEAFSVSCASSAAAETASSGGGWVRVVRWCVARPHRRVGRSVRPQPGLGLGHHQSPQPGQGRLVLALHDHRHLQPLRRRLDDRPPRVRRPGQTPHRPDHAQTPHRRGHPHPARPPRQLDESRPSSTALTSPADSARSRTAGPYARASTPGTYHQRYRSGIGYHHLVDVHYGRAAAIGNRRAPVVVAALAPRTHRQRRRPHPTRPARSRLDQQTQNRNTQRAHRRETDTESTQLNCLDHIDRHPMAKTVKGATWAVRCDQAESRSPGPGARPWTAAR
jgi:hypothetical protein